LTRSSIILLTADCLVSGNTGCWCVCLCAQWWSIFFQELLERSKVEYSELEKQLRSDTALMEKKYRKAKKLIREYQHRCCTGWLRKTNSFWVIWSNVPIFSYHCVKHPVQRKVLCENYNSWHYLKIVVTVRSKAIVANYMLSKHTKSKVVMKVIFEDIF